MPRQRAGVRVTESNTRCRGIPMFQNLDITNAKSFMAGVLANVAAVASLLMMSG